MSGFETFNDQGVNIISSSHRSVAVREIVTLGELQMDINGMPYGRRLARFPTPLGFASEMSTPKALNDKVYESPGFGKENESLMIRLNQNKRFCSYGMLCDPGAGDGIIISSDVSIDSGYLDVFNEKGELTWSAIHAAKVPRITGFIDIPPNFPLSTQIYQQYVGYSPYILYGVAPGSPSGDNSAAVQMGVFMMFKYTNGFIQVCCYEYTGTWWEALQQHGIRIPYGIIPSIPELF